MYATDSPNPPYREPNFTPIKIGLVTRECLSAFLKSLEQNPTFAAACDEIVSSLLLRPELDEHEKKAFPGLFLRELERRLPQLLTVVSVLALLPLLGDKARRRFLREGVSIQNSEDLSQDFVGKILKALCGGWPHGKVGAWLATIRTHLFVDHIRIKTRERDTFRNLPDQ